MQDLRKRRRLADVSQHRLARLADINRTRLSLAENGDVVLTPQEIERLERVLREQIVNRVEALGMGLVSQEVSVQQ